MGTAAAGAGLTIGCVIWPSVLGTASEAFAANNYSPTVLYTISPAGIMTVHVNKSEMGQHVGTALAQEIAEELEVDWKNMRLDYPDFTANFFTGGSLSILSTFMGACQAGAAGRMALLEAGAKQLEAKPGEVHADKGWVIAKDGKQISYAQLVATGKVDKVYKDADLKKIAIKKGGYKTFVGKPILALDIPAKTNGRALFGIDYFADNMVYAKIVRPPVRIGAKPKKNGDKEAIDDSEAKEDSWLSALRLDARSDWHQYPLCHRDRQQFPDRDEGGSSHQGRLGPRPQRQCQQRRHSPASQRAGGHPECRRSLSG